MKQNKKKKKMVVFTTTYSSQIGGIKEFLLGQGKKEVLDFEEEYKWRKLFGPWGLDILASWYKGYTEENLKNLSDSFYREYISPGFQELVFKLKEKGHLVGVVNPNPQFMMETLKENTPLDFALGLELHSENGVIVGKIKRLIHRYIEAQIVREKIQQYGLDKKDVITIGRSSVSHLPVAKESGIFIGFDPSKNSLKDLTRMIKKNQDLDKMLF